MKGRTAAVAVVAAAACFATVGVLSRWAFSHGATPLSLLAVRFVIAAAVLLGVQALREPASLRVGARDLARFAVLSLTGYGAASLCYMFAVREVGAAITTVLLFTYPALVAVLGWLFLRERLMPRRAMAIVVTFAGCALVSGLPGKASLSVPGLLLGLGAGLAYAVYSLVSSRTLRSASRLTLMAYMFAFSAVGSTLLAALTGDLALVRMWDAAAWTAVALVVAVPTLAAVVLYLGGVRSMGAQRAAVVSTLELPLTVILAAALYADERLGPLQVVGALIVLGGVLLAESGARPEQLTPAEL